MISIRSIDTAVFEVIVDSGSVTTHQVILSKEYHRKLSNGKCTPEELIRKSFEFLLERESSTTILRSFDLRVIGDYFPEYEERVRIR